MILLCCDCIKIAAWTAKATMQNNIPEPRRINTMTVLTRWEPVRELANLQDRVNRLFSDSFNPVASQESLSAGSFVPPVDVYEDEQNIRLKMEVPGIDEKDIDIRIENNLLTIRGERKLESETKEENYHRIERHYGSFTRSFTLPNSVNPEDVKASYAKGVLNIQLGKRAESRPKQIKVDVVPELAGKVASAK
jgi:HSP20 family protein